MQNALTITEAVQKLWAIALANRIPGEMPMTARELDARKLPSQALADGFTLNWERGWGADARLSVRATVRNEAIALVVQVGWSSTEQMAAGARTAAVLHAQVADIVCWMQAAIDAMPPLKVERE